MDTRTLTALEAAQIALHDAVAEALAAGMTTAAVAGEVTFNLTELTTLPQG